MKIFEEFHDAGELNGFFAKMNQWYYHSLGEQAFSPSGAVPYRLSTDEYLTGAIGQQFYQSVAKSKQSKFVVHQWGAGTILRPVEVFFQELTKLDPKILPKVEYVFSDYSPKMAQQAEQTASKDPLLKKYFQSGNLKFEVIDALKPPSNPKADLIFSSYLYDSLPQTVLAKQNGQWYQVFYRGHFKSDNDHLQRALEADDWSLIAQLSPEAFDATYYEEKLEQVKLEQLDGGQILAQATQDLENIRVNLSNHVIQSLEQALKLLKPGGRFQVFDLSSVRFVENQITASNASYQRFHGAFFSGVNFFLLKKFAQQHNLAWKFEHITDFLEAAMGKKVLSLISLALFLKVPENLDQYFSLITLPEDQRLEKRQQLSQELLKIVGGVDAPQIWLFEDDQNTLFQQMLIKNGLDSPKIVAQLFADRDLFKKRLNFFSFTLYN